MKKQFEKIISLFTTVLMLVTILGSNVNNNTQVYAKEDNSVNITVNNAIKILSDELSKKGTSLKIEQNIAIYKAGIQLKDKASILKNGIDTKSTAIGTKTKQAIALMDMDEDPSNYNGKNFIKEIADEINKLNENSRLSINEVKAINTLDMYNEKYKDKKVEYNIENAIKWVIADQNKPKTIFNVPQNISWGLNVFTKHKDIEGTNDAINKSLDSLYKFEHEEAGFYLTKFGTSMHAETVTQLALAGQKLDSNEWIKSGKNPIDALFNSWDGKEFKNSYGSKDEYAYDKIVYALCTLKNAGYGDYILKDVKFDNKQDELEKTYKVNVAVVYPVENGKYNIKLTPQQYTISNKDQKCYAGFTALGALQAATDQYVAKGSMVNSIFGIENKGMNGWVYTLNGVMPQTYANETPVKDGDNVVWYYSNSGMNPKVPTFEQVSALFNDKEKPIITVEGINDNDKVNDSIKEINIKIKDNLTNNIIPSVKLNDQQIKSTDEKYTLNLKEGENKLTIEAQDDAGNKDIKIYHIVYVVKTDTPVKNGISINQAIDAVTNYYNDVHFVENQGQLVNFQYSAMYRTGADLSKKKWYLVDKYESSYDKILKNLSSKVNQSLIWLDLDKDPNSYNDRQLINEIREEIDKNDSYFRQTDIQAVVALDKYNEKYPDKKVSYNVEHAIKKIIDAQCTDGGFKERTSSVARNTGYALIALSKHREIDGVNNSISKAIEYLHKIQKDDGGFYDTTYVTGYHAEVLQGIVAAGENPTSKEWTKASGKNAADALFALWRENGSFNGKQGESVNNRGWVEATWKGLYALIDLRTAGYGNYVVDGIKVAGISEKEEKTCKVNVAIVMPKQDGYDCMFTPKEVTISDKKHNKGFTALGALQAATILFDMSGDMVTSIYGNENKGLNGWMYTVNGVAPNESASKVQVKEGDKIIWYYSLSSMEAKIPKWEQLTNKKTDVKIKVRVEGLKNTLFDKEFTLKDEVNVKDVTLNALGNQNVVGADKGFITNILGEEKTDTIGWMYYLVDVNGDIKQGDVISKENIKDIKGNYYKEIVWHMSKWNGGTTCLPKVKVENEGNNYKLNITKQNVMMGIDPKPAENVNVKVEGVGEYITNEKGDISFRVTPGQHKVYIYKDAKDSKGEMYPEIVRQSFIIIGEASQQDNKIEDVIKDIKKYYENNLSSDYLTTLSFNHISYGDKKNFYLRKEDNTATIADNIMGVIAIGKNPYDYEGTNYVQELIKAQREDGRFVIGKNDENSVTALAEAIIALDMASAKYNTEKAIGTLVGAAKDGKYEDIDTTTKALIALSKHKNVNGVTNLISSCLDYLKKKQLEGGGFDYSGMGNSPYSTAPIIQALIAVGENPLSEKWSKGGKNPLDALLACKVTTRGFVTMEGMGADGVDITATNLAFAAIADIYKQQSMYHNFKFKLEEKPDNSKIIKNEINDIKSYYEKSQKYDFSTILGLKILGLSENELQQKVNIKDKDSLMFASQDVISIIGMAKNPRDYNGKNYVDILKNAVNSSKASTRVDQYAYALIAMDMASCDKQDIENIISKIKSKCKDGNFGKVGETALAITALSKHRDVDGVNEMINSCIAYLKAEQLENAAFTLSKSKYKDGDSQDTAFVIEALVSVGEDPLSSGWTKNGKTPLDALLSFKMGNGYIYHSTLAAYEQDMYTAFVLRAYIALRDKEIVFNKVKMNNDTTSDNVDVKKELLIENMTKNKELKLGDNAKIDIKVVNNVGKNKNLTLTLGLFDKNGKLVDYVIAEKDIKTGETTELTGKIKLPESGIYNVKGFVWDSFENMNPLLQVIEIPVK